jgi:hypothetical protein
MDSFLSLSQKAVNFDGIDDILDVRSDSRIGVCLADVKNGMSDNPGTGILFFHLYFINTYICMYYLLYKCTRYNKKIYK